MKKSLPVLWILRRVRRRIPALLLLVAAKAGTALLGVVFALGTRNVIDVATGGDRDAFLWACIAQGGIILGTLLCLTLSRHLSDRLLAVLDRDWKQDILHDLLRGDYSAVSAYHSGELINRLNNDVRIVNDGLVNAFPNLASMLTRLIGAMVVLISMQPWFALVVCAAGVVVILATGFMRKKLKGLHKKVNEKDGIVSAFLQETLEKLLLVQAMDISGEMEQRCDSLLEQRYAMQRKRKNVSLFANTGISVMSYGAGFIALLWSAVHLMAGQITFGTLTAITQLVSQLQAPFASLSGSIPQYVAMAASGERLMELEKIPADPEPLREDVADIYNSLEYICAEDLHFSYDRDPILEGAQFRLPKGAFAAIVGASGIGKSTLLKLLLGIYHSESGGLYLDCGEEKIPVDRRTRKLFSYVPQGNLLFSGTVRENLLVVKPDATQEQILHAVHISAMDEYLPQLPMGLETVLGESGAGLSEGQAQRLAIARAILCGAPILLLDECTSALDWQTEKTVLERIRSLTDCTCIAVSHRPATMELCDWQLEVSDHRIQAKKL